MGRLQRYDVSALLSEQRLKPAPRLHAVFIASRNSPSDVCRSNRSWVTRSAMAPLVTFPLFAQSPLRAARGMGKRPERRGALTDALDMATLDPVQI